MNKAMVIGCGVIGLSCGIRLLEQGFDVTIVARDLPPHTTSNVAAAVWYPYKAYPEDKVLGWGTAAYQTFLRLVDIPETGVSMTSLVEMFDRPTPDPWWREAVTHFRRATPAELPSGYQDGYVIETPLIETPIYMTYLVNRFQALDGRIHQKTITDLNELAAVTPLIINCTGLGARELVADKALYPIRGQIVRVSAIDSRQAYIDEHGPNSLSYIIPRRDGCILGGTSQAHDWNLEVEPETAAAILQKCRQIESKLEETHILQHLVGLRPGRFQVRLEQEQLTPTCTVIHNYGHGGAGVTLSWGCADEVAALVAGSL